MSEKGKMKSPFRLGWFLIVSVLLLNIFNFCVLFLRDEESTTEEMVMSKDINDKADADI